MKITKSKLLEMIKEEIKSLDEASYRSKYFDKDLRFKDLNWFKRLLGYKSRLADKYMDELERHMDKVDQYLSRPIEQQDIDEINELINLDIEMRPVGLSRIPDKEQRRRGEQITRRYKPQYDRLDKARGALAAAKNDAELERIIRAQREEERELLRKKIEQEERRAKEVDEFVKKQFAGRSSGSRKYNRDFGREYTRGSDLDWDEDISRLEETSKSKLERIIREELAKKINKSNKEN